MSDSTQVGTGINSRQTADRPVTANYREMEDTGSELQDLNLGLFLVTLICTLFSLFSVMLMHFGGPEVIFKALLNSTMHNRFYLIVRVTVGCGSEDAESAHFNPSIKK